MRTAPRSCIIFLALVIAGIPAAAQSLEYRAGLDGTAVAGRLTPFLWRGDAEQPGGSVELTLPDREGAPAAIIEAPYLAGPWIPFSLPHPAVTELTVRLRAGDFILSETPLAGRIDAWAGHAALAVGLDAASRSALARALEPLEGILAVDLAAEALPSSPLALDGVSVLAIRETDSPLSPSRLRSVAAWLASGGTLACLEAGAGGTADSLVPGSVAAAAASPGGWTALPVGFGRLVAVAAGGTDGPDAGSPDTWRAWLRLEPYERRRSLDPWPELSPGLAGRPPWTALARIDGGSLLVLSAWAVSVLAALGLAPRKRFLLVLAPVAAVSLALAALGASGTGPARPEANVRARLMVLPASAGAWLSLVGTPADIPARMGLDWLALERGWRIGLAPSTAAEGTLRFSSAAGHPPRLSLGAGSVDLTVRRADSTGIELAAWLPDGSLETLDLPAFRDGETGSPPLPEEGAGTRLAWLAPGSGQAWSEWNAGSRSWERLGSAPAWLGDDLAWMIRSHASTPDLGFLAGLAGGLPGIAAGGLLLGSTAWVMPWGDRDRGGAR